MKILNFLHIILSLTLVGGGLFLYNKVNTLGGKTQVSLPLSSTSIDKSEKVEYFCGEDCQKKIEAEVAKAAATVSAEKPVTTTTATTVEKTTFSRQTTYIPVGTATSTTSTDWSDVKSGEVWIDLEGDYGKGATVSWEASLKIYEGSGRVFARLSDATHGIAVDGSELSTAGSVYTLVSSSNLPFWRGRNLYRVQIKSLTGQPGSVDSARIKITY